MCFFGEGPVVPSKASMSLLSRTPVMCTPSAANSECPHPFPFSSLLNLGQIIYLPLEELNSHRPWKGVQNCRTAEAFPIACWRGETWRKCLAGWAAITQEHSGNHCVPLFGDSCVMMTPPIVLSAQVGRSQDPHGESPTVTAGLLLQRVPETSIVSTEIITGSYRLKLN